MSLRSNDDACSVIHQRQRRAFAVVPAAGESRRMGTAKLLLPWGASTVIESTIKAWRETAVASVVVVVSRANVALAQVCETAGANIVVPKVPPADMKASIQAAIQELQRTRAPVDGDCFLVAPADMPWIEPATTDRLISELAASSAEIIVPVHAGRRGHPVALSWALADAVLALGSDESLKTLVNRSQVREVECNATVLGDLDTPADYQAALRRYQSR
jgi:molybdenum cofactor cytidylyltransferase